MLDFGYKFRPNVEVSWAGRTAECSLNHVATARVNAPKGLIERLLSERGVSTRTLRKLAGDPDLPSLAHALYVVRSLVASGLIERPVSLDGRTICAAVPRRRDSEIIASPLPPCGRAASNVFCRHGGRGTELVHLDGAFDLVEADQVLAAEFLSLEAYGELADVPDAASKSYSIRQLLWATGFLTIESKMPPDSTLDAWEFHDLLFHTYSRGRADYRARGATYPLRGIRPAPNARRSYQHRTIELPEVDLLSSSSQLTLPELLECRSSHRVNNGALSLAAIATFFFRVCHSHSYDRVNEQEVFRRPYPSGGGLHELEFYLVHSGSTDLGRGIYHYDSHEHRLDVLPATEGEVAEVLYDAACSWDNPSVPPSGLVVITTRLERLAWKYEAMAYRTSLLNAGAALQTMYLVATDLGIACCGIGNGDSAKFSRILKVKEDYEASIAELALGGFLKG